MSPPTDKRAFLRFVTFLVFVSGAAALGHEIVWTRILADVFGTTAGAAAVVLACFMGGMGFGGIYFGRRADADAEPLKLYAWLEILAGATAVLVPVLVWLSSFIYGALFRAAGPGSMWLLTPARILLSVVALAPTSFLLGGTFPALVRYFTMRADETDGCAVSHQMGTLYALNTGGAVAGCFITGFLLIGGLGVLVTALLAGALSAAVGVAALLLSRKTVVAGANAAEPVAESAAPARTDGAPWMRWIVPALYGASGFAALGLEVLWTRSLVFVLRTTVYAFTAMLSVFLLGLAIGGRIGAPLARKSARPATLFAVLETGVAVSVASGLFILSAFARNWDEIDLSLSGGWAFSAMLHLGISALVMIVPTILLGMVFPVAGRMQARLTSAGSATGELYFGNTAGGVMGSLVAGFVLVPLIGTGNAILALACVSLFVAAGAIVLLVKMTMALKVRVLAGAAVLSLAAFVLVPARATTELFAAPIGDAELIHLDEGPHGTITVHRYPETGWHVLSAGGVQVAGDAPPLRSTQILQALIPNLVHGDVKNVLQVGLGSGETAYVSLLAGAGESRCVEIAPAVVAAAKKYFRQNNHGVLDDPRMSVALADGKNYLKHIDTNHDLILSESTYPFLSGSSGLYTLDYYEHCRDRLNEGGLVSIWLPLDVPSIGVRSIMRTFAEAFKYATLWTTNTYGYKHGLLLGSQQPIVIDYDRVRSGMERKEIAELLGSVGVHTPEDFIASLLLDSLGMRRYAAGADLHTDDRPVLEYQTSLRAGQQWRVRLADNMERMANERAPLIEHVKIRADDPHAGAIMRRIAVAEMASRKRLTELVALLRIQAQALPYLVSARRAHRQGRSAGAVDLYRNALIIDPSDSEARNELGGILIQLGRSEEAKALIRGSPNESDP